MPRVNTPVAAEPLNPTVEKETVAQAARQRVPFSTPEQKLHVAPIPGYHLHWFRGEPGRLQRALRAGYEFVRPEETELVNFDLASDLSIPGHTDLGDRVSVAAQDGAGEDGQFLRLYLMKLKEEFWQEDQAKFEAERIEPVVRAFTAGMADPKTGAPAELGSTVYRRPVKIPDMFKRKSGKT
jgi:hypothetical protein